MIEEREEDQFQLKIKREVMISSSSSSSNICDHKFHILEGVGDEHSSFIWPSAVFLSLFLLSPHSPLYLSSHNLPSYPSHNLPYHDHNLPSHSEEDQQIDETEDEKEIEEVGEEEEEEESWCVIEVGCGVGLPGCFMIKNIVELFVKIC